MVKAEKNAIIQLIAGYFMGKAMSLRTHYSLLKSNILSATEPDEPRVVHWIWNELLGLKVNDHNYLTFLEFVYSFQDIVDSVKLSGEGIAPPQDPELRGLMGFDEPSTTQESTNTLCMQIATSLVEYAQNVKNQ